MLIAWKNQYLGSTVFRDRIFFVELFDAVAARFSRCFMLKTGLHDILSLYNDRVMGVRLRFCSSLYKVRQSIDDDSQEFDEILENF